MNLPTSPYPSVAEGRPRWANPSAMEHLSLYVEDYEKNLQERDLLRIKCMGLVQRRKAWKVAAAHMMKQGCLEKDGCNYRPDPLDWSPMFRRIMVWLGETRD